MIKYIFPIWLAMTLNTLLGITDFYFLKPFGDGAYYIVGASTLPFIVVTQLLAGLGIETNRWMSEHQAIDFVKVASVGILTALLIIFVFHMSGEYSLFFIKKIDYIKECTIYFHILLFSILPLVLLFVLTGMARGIGKPKVSLFFTALIVILNVVLDYYLVSNMSSPTSAVAWATVIADSLGAITYIIWGVLHTDRMHFTTKQTYQFIVRALRQGTEKIISGGFFAVSLSALVAGLSLEFSGLYFALERYMMPLTLIGYAIFEWRIHQLSAKKPCEDKRVYIGLISILLIYTIFLISLLATKETWIYIFAYSIITVLFWRERHIIAVFFYAKKENTLLKLITVFKVLVVGILLLLYTLHWLVPANFFYHIHRYYDRTESDFS